MREREANAQNDFELTLMRVERDFTRAQLIGLQEELGSSQRELAIAKQCCLELSKAVATAEESRWRVGLKLFEV